LESALVLVSERGAVLAVESELVMVLPRASASQWVAALPSELVLWRAAG
jgi:hypothetical protein